MKLLILILAIVSSLSAGKFDLRADAELLELAHSEKFTNKLIHYVYDGKKYPIRIICNPDQETLFAPDWNLPFTESFIIFADLPLPLARYLEDLFPELWHNEDTVLDLRADYDLVQDSGELEPVVMAETIDGNDIGIAEVFQSKTFMSKVFYYYLNNDYYQVRIIHNPEGHTYIKSDDYEFTSGNRELIYKFNWSYKFGVIADKVAPKSLIDHISQIPKTTWWERNFNFLVSNGTYVTAQTHAYNSTTTYTLDTWFYFTNDLVKK